MQDIYQQLKKFGKVKSNEPLSKHTTFKIGGPANFFITIDRTEKLVELLKFLDGEGTPHFILGGGSNMLVGDEGFRGVVIKITDNRYKITDTNLVASSGMITVAAAQAAIKAGLTGFEWGVGVPGTIGGAVRGNAGAMGDEMKDVVDKVEVYRDGEVLTLSNHKCHFGYRHSEFKDSSDVVLRVWLKLKKVLGRDMGNEIGDMGGMKAALAHLQYRNKSQPQGNASTGCIFKNVDLEGAHGEQHRLKLVQYFDTNDPKVKEFLRKEKISAGWLVEQAGMKGKRVGQAGVSTKHGNFIVNMGGAKGADVLTLIEDIKQAVYDKYGIQLEEEIQII